MERYILCLFAFSFLQVRRLVSNQIPRQLQQPTLFIYMLPHKANRIAALEGG
jgi:hypothetical protein